MCVVSYFTDQGFDMMDQVSQVMDQVIDQVKESWTKVREHAHVKLV